MRSESFKPRHNPMNRFEQAAINSVGSGVLLLAQWLISVFLVRLDGFEAAGIFSLAMSVSNIFSTYAFYNFRNFRITDVKGEFTQRQYLTAVLLTIASSFVFFFVYIFFAGGYSAEERLATGIYLVYGNSNCAVEIIYAYVQVKGRLEINGYSNIIRGFCAFVSFLAAFLLTHDLILSLLIMTLSSIIIILVFDIPIYRRVTGERIAFFGDDFRGVISILTKCFPLMLAVVLPVVITAMPRRVIQSQLGEEQLGIFSSAFSITVLISTVVSVVSCAFLPGIAEKWNGRDRKGVIKSVAWCYVGVFLFMLAALLLSALFGRPVIALLFGKEMLDYFSLIYWSIIASSLYALTFVGGGVLTTMRRSKTLMMSIVFAFLLMPVLVGYFVSRYGIYGGAYIMILVYLVQNLIQVAAIIIGIAKLK